MFPFRDHNPSRRTPFVTYALLAANILVFLSYFPFLDGTRGLGVFYQTWGMIPANISQGMDFQTLITCMFLHGGWMHLIGNMLFLWIFGDNMEDALGHGPFLAFYLLTGLAASAAQILWEPGSIVPNVGASGAIAGVLGGYLLLYPKARVDVLLIFIIIFRIITVPAWIVLGLWFGIQVVSGFAVSTTGGGVAYWAHAGGFVAGVLAAIPFWLGKDGVSFWRRTDYHPPHPETQYRRSSIPLVKRK